MRTLLSAVLALLTAAAAAEPPLRMDYQGRLHDSAGFPREGAVLLNFRLYSAPSGGSALWSETHDPVPLDNGFFAVQLGAITALHPGLFAGASAYLEVDVDPAGAEPLETLWPRRLLAMTPWAFTASQLVSSSTLRVLADANASSFGQNGCLLLPYGLEAGTGTFSGSVTASSATFTLLSASQPGVFASSGARVAGGTLLVEGGGGVLARYGVVTATAVLTSAEEDAYSLVTASGARSAAGTVWALGGGGVLARYGVVAATASFTAEESGAFGVDASSGVRVDAGSLQPGLSAARTLSDRALDGSLFISSNAVFGGSVAARNFDFVFLASATIESPAATMSAEFESEGFQLLYVQLLLAGVADTCIPQLQFNGDTGADYSSNISDNGGGATSRRSADRIWLQGTGSAYQGFFNLLINNNPNTTTNVYINGGRGNSVTSAPNFHSGGGLWSNPTTSWLTRIDVLNDAGVNYSSDSSFRVFGIR